jgi:uncharacterized protein (DUF2267 family)
MTLTSVSAFENTLQTTNEWLSELNQQIGRDDPQQAYRMLRAVLCALRDRLTVEEATDLGAQLPMLIRGIYYESWNPSKTPTRERSRDDFLAHVNEDLADLSDGNPEEVTRAVFGVLEKHVTGGEVEHVRANLPSDLQELWPA